MASQHAQHNPNASPATTIDEVLLEVAIVADPLHRLDCCVITDGGGALVVVSPEVARDLPRAKVKLLGHGEAPRITTHGRIDLDRTGAQITGPAGVRGGGAEAHGHGLRGSTTR